MRRHYERSAEVVNLCFAPVRHQGKRGLSFMTERLREKNLLRGKCPPA